MRFELFEEWTTKFKKERDMDRLIETILLEAHSFFSADGSAIYLFDERELLLRREVDYLIIDPSEFNLPSDSGILGDSVSERKVIVNTDISSDPTYDRILGIEDSTSEIVIPLIEDDSVLGIIHLICKQQIPFQGEDNNLDELLYSFGRIAAGRLQIMSLKMEQEEIMYALQMTHAESVSGVLAASTVHQIRKRIHSAGLVNEILRKAISKENELHDKARSEYIELLNEMAASFTDVEAISTILLEMARGREIGSQAPAFLNDVIIDALSVLDNLAYEENVEIIPRFDDKLNENKPGDKFPISASKFDVQQILINLVTNSIESYKGFKRSGRKINIFTRLQNSSAILRVQDFGKGMDDDTLKKVFVPKHTTKEGGTGIGLSLCDFLIKRIGGKIQVISSPNKGSVFDVFFPLAEDKN